MSRTSRLVFGSLALFFVLFPLTVQKPGLPMNLRSDEPAYYLMALSLAHDGDLVCDLGDIQRLRREFPHTVIENLILMTDDGWRTVYFGKPYVISLLAAPLARFFGADGIVALNMALMMLTVWLGARYLARHNSEGAALLFSAGFFLLSNAFVYVFWLHTEVLCIAAVTVSLYLAWTDGVPAAAGGRWRRLLGAVWNPSTRPLWSGAVLMVAAYNKPVLALLGLPALWRFGRQHGRRAALAWLGGAVAGAALLCAISMAFTGHPSPYLGVERAGVRVEHYDRMPVAPDPAVAAGVERSREQSQQNSWWWIFRLPEIDHRLPENLLYFFLGRHTGLFLYAPFSLVALILFLAGRDRTRERWALVAALAGVALFFLTLIPFNWHGGGGFVGNRYFVNAYPALLFLVTRIPGAAQLAGYGLAGLFVGPLLFTPYGAPVPHPTLQSHVRNRPFRFFPFEMTITPQIPGYRGLAGAGTWFFGRRDVVHPVGDEIWVGGGRPVEIWFRTYEPLRRPVFQIETVAAPNYVRLQVGDASQGVRFASSTPPDNATRVVLEPSVPRPFRPDGSQELVYPYKFWITADTQDWRTVPYLPKPQLDLDFGGDPGSAEARPPGERTWREEMPDLHYLVGAAISLLGEEEELAADVYALEWVSGEPPRELRADRLIRQPATVRNSSAGIWRARGATRVALSYHWRHEEGSVAIWEGARTLLPRDVLPGEAVEVLFEIATPREPGRYLLELDAVRERLSWFSERNPASTVRLPVEVVPATGR